MFSVPDSSPPSTPNSRRDSGNHPSTTPAGPPPTNLTHNSFTPAGPPPSSVFGSSQFGSEDSHIPAPNFRSSNLGDSYSARSAAHTNAFTRAQNPPSVKPADTRGIRVPSSSPPRQDDHDGGVGIGGDDGDAMDEDDGFRASPRSPKRGLRQTGALGSPRSAKRSRYSDSMRQSIRSDGAVPNADVGGVAKGIAATMPAVSLHESSDLILGTENIVGSLYEGQQSSPSATVANELRALWHAAGEELNKGNAKDSQSVGPGDKANTVTKASFVTDLLLQLHFPSGTGANGTFKSSRFGRSSGAGRYDTPMPKVLLDWLNKSNPTDDDLHEILREQNGYSAAESFWDVIFTCVFRGKLTQAIRLLKGANWRVADCARMDGYEDAGYSGRQLQQTELAVNRIIALLESCPAVQNNDWDIKGNEWTLFRHRVRQALDDLKYHAEEGKEEDLFSLDQSTSARNSLFGISTSSRKAESRLPSFIFDSLTDMLTTFLGDPDEVVKSACDWVEAVVGIAVWWDGEEDNAGRGTLAASRKALQRSQHSRPSDVTPSMAYRQRLRYALDRTWQWGEEEQQLQINTSSSVEVALACVFADDVGGVLAILQKWSMTITAGLAEVASASGWLEQSKTRSTNLMQTFDQSDLMVLSYGQEETRKDAILTEYAELLRGRGALTDELFSSVPVEGWQLAVQILHRLDNERLGGNKISQMLNLLPLDTDATVDQLIAICDNLGLPDQVRSIAERYAESLTKNTNLYGSALLYYARAHNATKLREVLDLLISHCLVTSSAYPTLADLDPRLRSFITTPKQALAQLARTDIEAAELLSIYLSGYATLRRFYDLRDEEVGLKEGQKPKHRPLARKREAATALVAVIESAEDSIRGGLYDPDIDVVVQVDGLLALLGEALVFLNQSQRTFTLLQAFTVLKAVEDLEAVGSRIFEQCEAVLRSALANYHDGSLPPSLSPTKQQEPRSLQRSGTSGSGMTGSQFSLLDASSGFGSQEIGVSPASSGSELLVRARPASRGKLKEGAVSAKGWDWRVGFKRDSKGKDVLSVLRLALAKEVADGWMEEEE